MIKKYFGATINFKLFVFIALCAVVPFLFYLLLYFWGVKFGNVAIVFVVIYLSFLFLTYRFLKLEYFDRINKITAKITAILSKEESQSPKKNYSDEIDEIDNMILHLHKDLEEHKRALNESSIVTKSDLKGRITYGNENFYKISGLSKDEAIGKPHNIVRHQDMSSETFKEMWETIRSKKTWKGIIKNKKKNFGDYIIDATILPILDEDDNIKEYIAIRHDITELENNRREIERLATVDNLTGLGNRNKLMDDLEDFANPVVIVFDIDRFNEINDFYGQNIGDMIIEEFADRLRSLVTKDSLLYRYYADRFLILIDKNSCEDIVEYAKDIRAKITKDHLSLGNRDFSFQITVSISYENRHNIVSTAEMALKYAKRNKQNLVVYSSELGIEKVYENNILWTKKITDALRESRIVPYFQPILNTSTNRVEKYEALARMIDVDGKVISPFFFINAAKMSKQYLELTKKIFDQTIEASKNTDSEISINLTIEDISDKDHTRYMLEKISSLPKNKIVLELVESEGIENYDDVSNFIKEAKLAGAKIAVDDFGTGYSNFSYLLKLDVDYIKIDGSLIKTITEDRASCSVVETIISFAKLNGIKVIAEYASSKEILDKLIELNVDYAQGFYIGEPNKNFEILKRD